MVLWVGLAVSALARSVSASGNAVFVNGSQVLTFKAASQGVSPEQLAAKAASKLAKASGKVAVRPSGEDYVIKVGGEPVVTITRAEARIRGIDRKTLAYRWAGELQRVLVEAKRTPSNGQGDIRLPVGDQTALAIPTTVKVTSSDERFLSISKAGSTYYATALRPGTGFVTVNNGASVRQINFVCRMTAAKLPDSYEAEVTGRPAIPGTVRGAIEAALKQQTKFSPLAKLEWSADNVPALGAGLTVTVPVKISVTAPDTVARTGTVSVKVSNITLVPQDENVLWYCNDPERVEKPGNLFGASLELGRSARFLYHHINDSAGPLILRSQIVNDSDIPAKIALTPGDSAPDFDPVGAGMRAGDLFMRAIRSASAEIIVIPPRSTCPISFRRLVPQAVISGLAAIRLIEGPERVIVRADAFPPFEVISKWKPALSSSTPWREVGSQPLNDWDKSSYTISDHIYPDPIRSESWEYAVGGRMGVFRLGQKSIERQDSGGRLDGNFGVTVNLDTVLSNPTDETVNVEIAFETSAGYSGGLFFVDDVYLMTPKLLPKKQARIAFFKLAPGAVKKFRITTIPLSGSSYPATLFARVANAESSVGVIDVTKNK
jgi:hypothetical protein